MDSSQREWWHRHGWTIALLFTAFGLAFAIRTIFNVPVLEEFGNLYVYAGGSDSYYHSRVMTYIILNHTNLILDPLLKFPFGAINPREPLFDWMNAILGLLFAPLFGGNANVAGAFFLNLQGPLWAALSVFPIYLIGKEVSSRRMGLIAAMIFPFFPASIDASTLGYGNYLSFYTFVILITIYAYIRTLKATGTRRWVVSYRHPRDIGRGLRAFLREERMAVKWAVFTGVCFGALALSWQGYTYFVAVVAIFLTVGFIIERIRHVDMFGTYIVTLIVGAIGFPMAFPYYIVQHEFAGWFDLPLLLFFGALLLLLPFLCMRDVPWVFSIPFLIGTYVAGALVLAIFLPNFFVNIVTGQGYFVKTLIYSTVAEVQAPSLDQLVIGYGLVTFYLALVGVALYAWAWIRGRFSRIGLLFLVFAVLSIYLPISASKFFLIGAPGFALLAAETLRRAIDYAGYPELRRTVTHLSDTRSQFSAFRKALKPRHVVILLVVVGLILPNIWISIDAGIPGNTKTQFSEQVYNTLPPGLRPTTSSGPQSIFGAAGTQMDTPNQYDSAMYSWLGTRDTQLPIQDRPAFISWWDYGFQEMDQGQHPTVADNFQNGIDPGGQFLLAQNESIAIGVLTTAVLFAEMTKSGGHALPAPLTATLERDGVNVAELTHLLVDTSADYRTVVNNPHKYLPVNPATMTLDNAMYFAVSYYLADSLPLSGVAQVYNDVQAFTGWTIRYAMTDMRLFPFSGTDTGIFYAPADLVGRVVNSFGVPTTFFNVTVLGTDGHTYPLGQLPANVGAVRYNINYFSPFYKSMIYRTYIGYNGTQIGLSGGGIPGLSGAAASYPVKPGWMMQHFRVIYQTAYYCPSKTEARTNPNCFTAMNKPTALALANKTGGVADTSPTSYFNGGGAMLEYYPGQTILGRVVLPNGQPVPGARVTIFDSWGIPHMTVTTGPDGSFSLVAPPGNDTLNITTGAFNPYTQQDALNLKTVPLDISNAVGLSLNAPPLPLTVRLGAGRVQGFVYWNSANNSTYIPTTDAVIPGAQVVLWGGNNTTRLSQVTDASGAFDFTNVPPGNYNLNILYDGQNYTEATRFVGNGSTVNATTGLQSASLRGTVLLNGVTPDIGAAVTLGNRSGVVATTVAGTNGAYSFSNLGPGNYTVRAVSAIASGFQSAGVPVEIQTPGQSISQNLTDVAYQSVAFQVVAAGVPAAHAAVRFTPLPSFANASASVLGLQEAAANRSMTIFTGSNGIVRARLPAGNYSVYALTTIQGVPYSGFTSIYPSPSGGLTTLFQPLTLAPSVTLRGTVVPAGPVTNSSRTFVEVYNSQGGEVSTWVPPNSTLFSLQVPSGAYTVAAWQGASTPASPLYAAMVAYNTSSGRALTLAPVPTLHISFSVGQPSPNSTAVVPAPRAAVTISAGAATLFTRASSAGQVYGDIPSILPAGTTYCVSATSFAFNASRICGLDPSNLSALSNLPMTLTPVPVTLSVVGLPAGVPVQVNLTSESPTAVSRSFTGGPTFRFLSAPGVYGVGARARVGSVTVYLPPQTYTTTIAPGAQQVTLTLLVVPQINTTGKLVLPAGLNPANVTVTLSSPLVNVTVNGTQFLKGFYAGTGNYSVLALGELNGTAYSTLVNVTVGSDGRISAPLNLTVGGATVSGALTTLHGALVNATTPILFTAPSGATVQVVARDGRYSTILPTPGIYRARVNATLEVPTANGTTAVIYSTAPGYQCSVSNNSSQCNIPLISRALMVSVNLTLTATGAPGAVGGTIHLLNLNDTALPPIVRTTSTGRVSLSLEPGVYSVYANSSAGDQPLATFQYESVFTSGVSNISLPLRPAWLDLVEVRPPSSLGSTVTGAQVTVQDSMDRTVLFPSVPVDSPLTIALPPGSYSILARAVGSPYGVSVNATASAQVQVVSGNQATSLALSYRFVDSVVGRIVGPTSIALPYSGGNASFGYAFTSRSTQPLALTLVGTPAYWGFHFSAANVTFGVSGPARTVSGEVTISVPSGTPVAHPTVLLQAQYANGTTAASVAPTIVIAPHSAAQIGPLRSVAPQISPTRAVLSLYVANIGNQPENVTASIANLGHLALLGWTGNLLKSGRVVTGPIYLNTGANLTLEVNLTVVGSVFSRPQSVQVAVTVLSTGTQHTLTLTVPTVTVVVGGPNATVTGPSIGTPSSALPSWVVPVVSFVPALALVAGVLLYQWNRTRRWTRR
ncbi:MAG: carboxypeptidase regulatory-like domain-containing protein [Thermoplasmata archaeon]